MGGLDEDRQEAAGDRVSWHLDPTGVPQLDEVLGGGIRRGTTALIVGPPGSGKTTLAAQMAFAAGRLGRRALLFTALSESTGKIVAHLQTYRFFDNELVGGDVQLFSLTTYLAQGVVAVLDGPPGSGATRPTDWIRALGPRSPPANKPTIPRLQDQSIAAANPRGPI